MHFGNAAEGVQEVPEAPTLQIVWACKKPCGGDVLLCKAWNGITRIEVYRVCAMQAVANSERCKCMREDF